MSDSTLDLIERSPENAPFWQAAAEKRLVLQRCLDCKAWHWLPRGRCVHCGTIQMGWEEASGRGIIHSYAVMHREAPPVIQAVILLEEGVAMLSHIVTDRPESLHIGMAVCCQFMPLNGIEHAVLFMPDPRD